MTGIGGPGGIGGPKGPGGADRMDGPSGAGDVAPERKVDAAAKAPTTSQLDAIAADLAAGKLTPREAIDRLVDEIAGNEDLMPGDRAELREMMSDLIANDPHLQSLVGRL